MISREKQIYENAAGIFTFGNNTRRVLMEKYGISPEKIIVAGVGTNIPYDRLKKIPIVPERYYQKRILFVGEEWDLKGGEELFSAFKKVRERIGGATLTIAGCHPGIICPGVEVLGKINYEELIKQYARASVFCLPSKHEAFGVVFIEAMASGLPVIALNLSEAPDFVKNNETGFLVEHNDKAGLVEVLLRMLTDPGLCMSFAERARVLAEERYNWNVVSNKISSRMKAICEVS
jgi:glycosyltransferase involved in cell wall biosynthesis